MTPITVRRMLLAVCAGLLAAGAARADAPAYALVPAQSTLSFSATQQGEKFTGTFKDFEAHVAYAPDQLGASSITATIRMKSLDSKSQDRDSALAGSDWFDFAKFSTASFRTTAIRMTPSGPVGDAELTIRSVTKRIAFPFTFKSEPARATLDARVTLDRIDFGVGTGEWADESIASHKVEVTVHLVLVPAPAAPAKH